MYFTAALWRMPPPSTPRRLVLGTLRWTPRRSRYTGLPWSRSLTLFLRSQCSMCLYRRRRNRWWKSQKNISFSSQQRTVEQNVDTPVAGSSGVGGGLSGFTQDRILQRSFRGTEPLTFLLVEVFKVYNVDRVQQRFYLNRL